MTCAQDFLDASNPIFEECQHGVATLSRLVVATPSALAGEARTALVPALYAYWERFFRLVFAEYLRSVSMSGLRFDQICTALARHRVRKEFRDLEISHRERLLRKLDNESVEAARQYIVPVVGNLGRIENLFATPIDFPRPDEWVSTDANVRYEVVEKNCSNIGVDPEKLKKILGDSQIQLYPRLKGLVDVRNDIAHGNVISPMNSDAWNELQAFVVTLMNAVQLFLYDSLVNDEHLFR